MSAQDHGHTPAAWTGSIITFIGFCVAGAFMVMAEPVGFWAGCALIAVGGAVGGIMTLMGLGAKPKAHILVGAKQTRTAAAPAAGTAEPQAEASVA